LLHQVDECLASGEADDFIYLRFHQNQSMLFLHVLPQGVSGISVLFVHRLFFHTDTASSLWLGVFWTSMQDVSQTHVSLSALAHALGPLRRAVMRVETRECGARLVRDEHPAFFSVDEQGNSCHSLQLN
jgi:hypothetical protein